MTYGLLHHRDDSYARFGLYEVYNSRFNPDPRSASSVPTFSYQLKQADLAKLRAKSQAEAERRVNEELDRRGRQLVASEQRAASASPAADNESVVSDDTELSADLGSVLAAQHKKKRRSSSISAGSFYSRTMFV